MTSIVRTRVIVKPECKSYEPTLLAMLGCWAVSMVVAVFFAYGVYKAFEVFLERVGLGG